MSQTNAYIPPVKPVSTVPNRASEAMREQCYRKRRLINRLALSLSMFAMTIGLGLLAWILWTSISAGISSINITFFTAMTPPPSTPGGGLANAIVGSLIMVSLATLVGTPIGMMAGIYLSEYGRNHWLARSTRFINDILLSAPSIVIGLFVAAIMVKYMRTFSGLSGVVALSLIQIPIVVRTTENTLNLVPDTLREAAIALGTPRWKMIMHITLKAAYAGIVTGILLGLARISGETAPLLFTALNNQFWSTDLLQPMASVPVVIYHFAMSSYPEWQALAWGGVFLIACTVLTLNILARCFFCSAKRN